MDFEKVSGVKISPSLIEFYDAEPNIVHRMKISIQNLDKVSKHVKILSPTTENFCIQSKDSEKFLAPGLELISLVEYFNHKGEDCEDHIVVKIDDNFFEIPLLSYAPKSILTINGTCDIGTIVADGQVYTRDIAILNHGIKFGDFKIYIEDDLPFKVMPLEGSIQPGYSQPIRFEFISDKIGEIDTKLRVLLDNEVTEFIEFKVNVVSRNLQVQLKNKRQLVDRIDFGCTYYGSDIVKSFSLCNGSPVPLSYVAVLEEDGEGEEKAVDVTKSVIKICSSKGKKEHPTNESLIIEMVPNEGTIQPYEDKEVFFKFSPRFTKPKRGWKKNEKLAPRRDYALFMHIKCVGVVNTTKEDLDIELAIIGTALPVAVSILPSLQLNFPDCQVGEQAKSVLQIRNDSGDIPICYAVRKIAHFYCSPNCGYVNPDNIVDLFFSFQPKQNGTFKSKVLLDIIGQICTIDNKCKPVYKKVVLETRMVLVNGISPLTYSSKLKQRSSILNGHSDFSVKMLTSKQTAMESDFKINSSSGDVRIAHPNDRACSIRPSDKNEPVRTHFTQQDRYTYVDPDYSYSQEAREQQKNHKEKYVSYICNQAKERKTKKSARDFKKYENEFDLGMKPAHGLRAPKLKLSEMKKELSILENNEKQSRKSNLLSTKIIDENKNNLSKSKVVEGLKAFPFTSIEKKDCSLKLSPQELYQVNIEHDKINFGDVCRKSVTDKLLKIANNLNKHIHIMFDIDCKELRQTSPVSQVIPPKSVAQMEFIFESPREGKFQRSINYIINSQHKSHILVHANIVNVYLELAESEIFLQPTHGAPVEAGFRKTVELINPRNMAAEFCWTPLVSVEGTSFTIRPAKGVVERHSSLTVEVAFYPSYFSNCSGDFVGNVEGGNELTLHCEAQIGYASCSFIERRLMFGSLPLQLVTARSAYLKNTSTNHAFFKILNPTPIEGMTINPKQGVVSVGGITEIQVLYRPETAQKFDTTIQVDILGWKTISLRMGGHVEYPVVDLDIKSFNFGGIYMGATASVPFKIKNMARSNVLVVFNLSAFKDFKVIFSGDGEGREHSSLYHINVFGQQTVDAVLQFIPSEIAAYDFFLPVSVNHMMSPTPAVSPCPPTIATSNCVLPSYDIPTARRRVRATALQSPLQLSTELIEFKLPALFFDLKIEDMSGRIMSVRLVNNSTEPLTWSFCLDQPETYKLFVDGVFSFLFQRNPSTCIVEFEDNLKSVTLQSGEVYVLKILFQPLESKKYECKVPIILNNKPEKPYKYLHLSGELLSPAIYCKPDNIKFQPLPLGTKATLDVDVFYRDFTDILKLSVEIPPVELEDGSVMDVLQVKFKNDDRTIKKSITTISSSNNNIDERQDDKLSCTVTFQSLRPVSFSTHLRFVVGNTSCKLKVCGTADNCILTTYNFLSNSSTDFHIVCERFKDNTTSLQTSTETVFVPCVSPIRAPTGVSMTTSSNSFSLRTSSYEDSALLLSSSSELSEEGSLEQNIDSETYLPYQCHEDVLSDTEEGKTLREILKSVQRWYSSQAWANGPCPISIPGSLRSCLNTDCCNPTSSRSGSWNRDNSIRKGGSCYGNRKNIVEIISHLCGKQVPGIPNNASLPMEKKERIKSILWIYSTLLTFLKCQGGMVSTILAHDLLDVSDHGFYVNTMMTGEDDRGRSKHLTDYTEFDMRSKKAWTDTLLQVLKVFVLGKITPTSYKKMALPVDYPPLPVFNPNPFCSNVYSISERLLLAWLNHHYEQQRSKCWKQQHKHSEVKPPSRWIVNFENDFVDGLVLASLVCAYAPYVAASHLTGLYSRPNSAEQCLSNALKVVTALRKLGIDYDVMATDITEPSAVNVLLLCVHLYHRLPYYLPSRTVVFSGSLFSTVTKQIKLSNASSKAIVYQAVLVGKYSNDFSLRQGNSVQVPAKSQVEIPVEFKSRFLRQCDCTLVLIGKRVGSAVGSTMTLSLKGIVSTILPLKTLKFVSPCYELEKVSLKVENPFPLGGNFRMVIVETDPYVQKIESVTNVSKKNNLNVLSKTDHGQKSTEKKNSDKNVDHLLKDLYIENKSPILSVFWSPDQSTDLGPYGSSEVEIQFLPFDIGTRQCSVLFLNEEIGEFLYSVKAESLLPLPTEVPFFYHDNNKQHGSRVTSAMASYQSQGLLREDNSIIYLHCHAKKKTIEELAIPVHNYARGKALLLATEQRMSEKELQRRERSGVTSSETVVSAISCLQISKKADYQHPSELLGITGDIQEFSIQLSSPYFSCSDSISIPVDVLESSSPETVKLPLTISPCEVGQYNCSVVLKAANDIRVYRIECTIKDADSDIEMEFTSPAHQSVSQDIPIINHSDVDWHLTAQIEGKGFVGPPVLVVHARTSASYSLCFQPVYEGQVEGRLVLTNKSNGAETCYYLSGLGTKPFPVDELQIDCIVNESTMKVLEVTNKLQHKMIFQVFSDCDLITGPPFVTVLPQQTASVPFNILTRKRGVTECVVCFVYDETFVKEMGLNRVYDADSDDEDSDDYDRHDYDRHMEISSSNIHSFISTECSSLADLKRSLHFQRPYKLWYSLRINSIPTEPVKCLQVQACVASSTSLELLLKNPQKKDLNLDVIIDGFHLYGEASITVKPYSSIVYQLQYSPVVTGKSKACVIFQSESCTEFWYDIVLIAENPLPKQLPMMQCQLGKSCVQNITMSNRSVDDVTYDVICSNSNNFQLEGLEDMKLTVPAMCSSEVSLVFVPSSLKTQDHKAQIVFYNESQGSCFTYDVIGVVDKPTVADKYYVHADIGGNASIIIPFQNPFFEDIVVDIELKETLQQNEDDDDLVFGLLLKKSGNLVLPGKSILDIPISYAPDQMRKKEALFLVHTKPFNTNESNFHANGIVWKFEIDGIPTCAPVKNSHAPVIKCRARERVDEKIELTFLGAEDGDRSNYTTLLKSLSPIHLLGQYIPPSSPAEMAPEYEELGDEKFDFHIESSGEVIEQDIQRSVSVQLKKQTRHRISRTISLLFDVIFASSKPFNHLVHLIVTSTYGGVWKFPLRFTSTEALSDDVINIKSNGLNKESKVAFRLDSQTSDPTHFEAHFASGYDDMFTVTPTSGMLRALEDNGTLFTVSYKPKFYGKKHCAKLLIQTREFQWIYDIKGETPEYTPPRAQHAAIESHISSAHQPRVRRRNYIRDNLHLESTAVSSPLKGAPLLSKISS